jgi:hypothetical protein
MTVERLANQAPSGPPGEQGTGAIPDTTSARSSTGRTWPAAGRCCARHPRSPGAATISSTRPAGSGQAPAVGLPHDGREAREPGPVGAARRAGDRRHREDLAGCRAVLREAPTIAWRGDHLIHTAGGLTAAPRRRRRDRRRPRPRRNPAGPPPPAAPACRRGVRGVAGCRAVLREAPTIAWRGDHLIHTAGGLTAAPTLRRRAPRRRRRDRRRPRPRRNPAGPPPPAAPACRRCARHPRSPGAATISSTRPAG